MMKMKDIDTMSVDQIIRLPFFFSLERDVMGSNTQCWKITFRCNKLTAEGGWQLLDELSDKEHMVRYKIIDF
jgi:hypothetical protein